VSGLKQLNVRIPIDLHDALGAHKERTGEEKSEVIRRGIELALGQPSRKNGSAAIPPSPRSVDEAAAAQASPPAEPEHREGSGSGVSTPEDHVDLAAWLSERFDTPRALCRLRILAGHVLIDGRRWQEETVPAALLEQPVALDGRLVVRGEST
jgi:hypothetical protein